MRAQLISAITSATSTLTQFAISQELPWAQNGTPLYRKNMKRIYVDQDDINESTMINTLDNNNVMQDNINNRVYVAVDAKNPPTQLDQLIRNILGVKDSLGIANFTSESDYTIDKQEDVLIYTFEFRLNTVKQ
jgi:hypothetical protein